MRISVRLLALMVFPALAHAAEPAAYKANAGPYKVASFEADWNFAESKAGARDVPIKMYFPQNIADLPGALPVIVFSHGLGGSRDGYEFWAAHWASHGYVVVLPTHVGSDTGVLRTGGMAGLRDAMNVQNFLKRVEDVHFVIDQLEKINDGQISGEDYVPLLKKIDMKHIGMAGHSFGAVTTMSVSGQSFVVPGATKLATDPRITCAIAMSPSPAAGTDQDAAFGSIKIPILHLTGTEDVAPGGLSNVQADQRRVPFDHSNAPGTMLIIFDGANHMTFAPMKNGQIIGARLREASNTDAETHPLIKEVTTAFWDDHLKGDEKAKSWLATDLPQLLQGKAALETKPAK